MIWRILLIIAVGYLLGNLNGAIMISTHVYGDDVRNHGSGNAGMTNFARTYGKAKLVPVILIDVGKTLLACFIGWLLAHDLGYGDEAKMLAGIATMVGHALPVFYGFHGGKGVLVAVHGCQDHRHRDRFHLSGHSNPSFIRYSRNSFSVVRRRFDTV